MWLIHIDELTLEEFIGDQIPSYAILSHTWGKEEVSFRDFQNRELAETKAGFRKILEACNATREFSRQYQLDLRYVWVDTCCIDKSSSAELSEAINSMFAWYQRSKVCFCYLEDVDAAPTQEIPDVSISHSRWFTRGWTLQELLAPDTRVFLNKHWACIGWLVSSSKDHWNPPNDLSHQIRKITGIGRNFLEKYKTVHKASIAQRMSWASGRTTTRVEDMAYCLLGLFDINIPLLYGEGSKAFIRLQEEIIRVSTDHTIFCWNWIDRVMPMGWASLLAPSAAAFAESGDYVSIPNAMRSKYPPVPYQITNAGVNISLPIMTLVNFRSQPKMAFARLEAYRKDRESEGWLSIPLRPLIAEEERGSNTFQPLYMARVKFPKALLSLPIWWFSEDPQSLCVPSRPGPHLVTLYSAAPVLRSENFQTGFAIFVRPKLPFEVIIWFGKSQDMYWQSTMVVPPEGCEAKPPSSILAIVVICKTASLDKRNAIYLAKTNLGKNELPKYYCRILPSHLFHGTSNDRAWRRFNALNNLVDEGSLRPNQFSNRGNLSVRWIEQFEIEGNGTLPVLIYSDGEPRGPSPGEEEGQLVQFLLKY